MKKTLTLLLILVMCLSMLTSCFGEEWNNRNQVDETDAALTAAADFLYNVMKDKEGAENVNDFDVVKKLVVDNVTYEVTWTTDNDKVKIVPSSKASYWTVDIPTTNDTAFSYKLTATIQNANGQTITKEFNRKVPVIGADNALIVSDPQEGVDYKLFIVQYTARKVLFLKGATQNNENKYILGGDAKDGAIFRVEKAEGGVKIYTMIDGAKQYINAYITLSEDGQKTSKYLGFSADKPSVFYYKQNVGAWFTMIDNAEFVIGTYSTFETASLSEGKFMTEEAVANKEQFAVSFMTKANADTYTPPVFEAPKEPADGSTLTIKEAIELGKTFPKNGYTTGKFVVSGTVKQIQNDIYGNVMITDGTNDLLVYGMYDPAGKRFDQMELQPKVGDVITVKGVIGMYNDAQLKDGTLQKINDTVLGGGSTDVEDLVLDMMGTTTRTEYSTDKTVHSANGVTYVNAKGSSTTDNYNQTKNYAARAYKGSVITISADKAFMRIVFDFDSYEPEPGKNYFSGFDGMTVAGATITRDGDKVTVVLAEAAKSITFGELLGQVRIEEIAVYETAGAQGGTEKPGEGETGMTLVTEPQVGVGYYLRLEQKSLGKILYLNGNTANKDWYLASVEDPADAVLVYLEAVAGTDGAYRLYFDKAGTKTYIRVYERDAAGQSGSLELVTSAPEEYFTFNSELKTLMYTKGENSYILNTYNTFDTFCVSHISKASGNYVSGLYQKVEAGEPKPPHVHDYKATVVAPTCTEAGYTEHKCECGDSYKDTYVDALGHKDENGDKVCDGCGIDREIYNVVEAPVAGIPYFFGLAQEKLGYNLYFSGKTANKDYYLAAEKSVVTADTRVFLETVAGTDGAYRLYFETEEGGKIYIRVYEIDATKQKGSLALVSQAPAEYFTYDAALKTLVYTVGENAYYIGTYGTYNTLSVSHVSFAATSYVAHFYAKNVTGHHAYTVTEIVAPTCTAKGYSVYTCTCGDSYKSDYTDMIPHVDHNDDKFCDVCQADVRIYDVLIGTPVVGTEYYIGIFQGNLDKVLYFNGKTANKDYYLGTVEIPLEGMKIYLEEVNELGRRIYFYDAEGVKTYIRVYERDAEKKSGSLALTTLIPVEYFVFDETLNALVYKAASGNAYYLGTYSTFNTLSVSHIDYATKDGNFVARLYTIDSVPHEHIYPTSKVIAPTCSVKGCTEHYCPCGYVMKDAETALDINAHTDADADNICDACALDVRYDIVTAPVAGQAYLIGLQQKSLDKMLFFTGKTANQAWYLSTSDTAVDCVKVYLEAVDGVEGAYRLYFDNEGVKTYIRVYERGTKSGSLELVTSAPAEYFTFDKTRNTLVYTKGENAYILNTYGTYNTLCVSHIEKAPENFISHLYLIAAEDGHVHDYATVTTVNASCGAAGHVLHVCACGDFYRDAWVDRLPHLDSDKNGICENGCGEFIGAPIVENAVTPAPATAYKLVMYQGRAKKTVYFAGVMSSHYGATVTAADGDANVYIEETTGGFYMYCVVEGVKTYINMVTSGTYVNISLAATASTVYTYDADLCTAVAKVGGSNYVFGTRADKTYTTIGPVAANSESYIMNFVLSTVADSVAPTPDEPETPVDPNVVPEGATHKKITSAAEFTTGSYVIVVSTGYAPTTVDTGSNPWIQVAQPTVVGDYITDAKAAVWTITVTGSTVTLKDSSGNFIAPKGGNNNGIKIGEYSWNWTMNDDGTIVFTGTGTDTVTLASNTASGNKMRGYKNATVSASASTYPSNFSVYKLIEG